MAGDGNLKNPIAPKSPPLTWLLFGFFSWIGFVVGFVFLRQAFLRQAQCAQPVHILKSSRVARRFLLQCFVDFRLSPLIAV